MDFVQFQYQRAFFKAIALALFGLSLLSPAAQWKCPQIGNPALFASDSQNWRIIESWEPNQRILIVGDGLSSGGNYVVRAKELFPDVKVVHIRSSARLPSALFERFFDPKNYDAFLNFGVSSLTDLRRVFGRFNRAGVRVVTGTETGIWLHDRLSSDLGLPSNGTRFSGARTNKILMAKAVEPYFKGEPGLSVMPGREFFSAAAAIRALRYDKNPYPRVLKPVDSAGSFGFTLALQPSDVVKAFKEYVGKPDPVGNRLTSLLMQPYRPGTLVAPNLAVDPVHGPYLTEIVVSTMEIHGNSIV